MAMVLFVLFNGAYVACVVRVASVSTEVNIVVQTNNSFRTSTTIPQYLNTSAHD